MQFLTFHPDYLGAIQRGEKITTVRWNEPLTVGPAIRLCDGEQMAAEITDIHSYGVAELTPEAAHAPSDTDMNEFVNALRHNYYPTMPDGAVLEVVTFRVLSRPT